MFSDIRIIQFNVSACQDHTFAATIGQSLFSHYLFCPQLLSFLPSLIRRLKFLNALNACVRVNEIQHFRNEYSPVKLISCGIRLHPLIVGSVCRNSLILFCEAAARWIMLAVSPIALTGKVSILIYITNSTMYRCRYSDCHGYNITRRS